MSGWPRWARADAPGSLAQYVLPDLVARLTPGSLPGRSAEPAMSRLRRIYDALAAAGIDYVDEPVTSEPGLQALRPTEQVLVRPGGGTCLDVAVVAAGAALHAGLHPLVVVLDPESGTGPGHAMLVVWLDGDWAGRPDRDYPLATVVLDHPPADILADLCFTAGASGAFAAVDVAAVARHRVHGSAPAGEPIPTFDEALAAGATMLTSGAAATGSAATFTGGTVTGGRPWRWSVGIDVGVGYRATDALATVALPAVDPLSPPYLDADADDGPLAAVRARNGVVPFQSRDELDALLDWCTTTVSRPDPSARADRAGRADRADRADRAKVRIVTGPGGAGKTHLLAELTAQLAADGWYTGFLRDELPQASLD